MRSRFQQKLVGTGTLSSVITQISRRSVTIIGSPSSVLLSGLTPSQASTPPFPFPPLPSWLLRRTNDEADVNVSCRGIPIVLIDRSGSTVTRSRAGPTKGPTVLDAERSIAQQVLRRRGYSRCTLIYWNCCADPKGVVDVDSLLSHHMTSDGGTSLSPAINHVLQNQLVCEEEGVTEIFIITDGEIQDEDCITRPLREILAKKVALHLIAVEGNDNNYLEDDCMAGNILYNYLKREQKMNLVRSITSFNDNHREGFTALQNLEVPDGYIPFQDLLLLKSDFGEKFFVYLRELVAAISTASTTATDKDMTVLKLSHDLTRTAFYMAKGLIPQLGIVISERIMDIFQTSSAVSPALYVQIRERFFQEVANHINNTASSFQCYRHARQQVYEECAMKLFTDTLSALPQPTSTESAYITMVVSDTVILVPLGFARSDVYLGRDLFPSAGITVSGCALPLVATKFPFSPEANNADTSSPQLQALRQWIRANYCRVHGRTVTSSDIVADVMFDMLRIFYSKPSEDGADREVALSSYRYLVHTLLSTPKFGAVTLDVTMLTGLHEGGRPTFLNALKAKCRALNKDENAVKIRSYMLWYAMLHAYGDTSLFDSQKSVWYPKAFETADKEPSTENNPDQWLSLLEKVVTPVTIQKSSAAVFTVPPHDALPGLSCPSKVIDAPDRCTNCHAAIVCTPASEQQQQLSLPEPNIIYSTAVRRSVLNPEAYDGPLMSMDTLDWTPGPPHFAENVIIRDALNVARPRIASFSEFQSQVFKRFPFIKDLDLENVALAGGFVRSVLLKQKLKDFDFFFYGLDDPYPRMIKLMEDVVTAVKKHEDDTAASSATSVVEDLEGDEEDQGQNADGTTPIEVSDGAAVAASPNDDASATPSPRRRKLLNKGNTKFLYMYKPQFNVFEIIYIRDPSNHFNEEFVYDNFKRYKYKTMRHFFGPGKCRYDRDATQVMSTPDKFYFEDGDTKGIRILQRFQFIMAKHDSIESLLKGFDMAPCCVAYTGKDLLFAPAAYTSYRYMANVIRTEEMTNELYDYRTSKYLSYGFDMAFPFASPLELLQQSGSECEGLDKDSPLEEETISLGKLEYTIVSTLGNQIFVEHDSHREKQQNLAEQLELEQQVGGDVALYKSSMFPSLAGILRYMCTNKINYLFSSDLVLPPPGSRVFPFTTAMSALDDNEKASEAKRLVHEEYKALYLQLKEKLEAKDADLLKRMVESGNPDLARMLASPEGHNQLSQGPCELTFIEDIRTRTTHGEHCWFNKPTTTTTTK